MKARRRGFILIVALVIMAALVSLVIALGRTVRSEHLAASNELAAFEAEAVEAGAEQYVLALLTNERDTYDMLDETLFARVPVGRGFFWIIRPQYDPKDGLPAFGLIDESSKLDLNTQTYARLRNVPGVTQEMAASIVDWRDPDDTGTDGIGAESGEYSALADGYRSKNAPFENVEELSFVKGFTHEVIFGPRNSTGVSVGLGVERWQSAGMFDDFTVWSRAAQGGTNAPRGRVNINAAPREVLRAFNNILSEADIEVLMSKRTLRSSSELRGTTWVQEVLPTKAAALNNLITAQGAFYSADIVAVSGSGRAFKRVRIVVDTSVSPQKIVYRRDLTVNGFPMDPSILQQLREGKSAL